MSDLDRTQKLTREQINALRLKAFASNSHDDRMAYYKACSGWFQDEDYRELARALPAVQPAPVTVEALEARLNAIAFLARDGACDMKGRRLDEYYDTQMEVTRDPCGAFMAIEAMSDALDDIRRAALAGEKPNE
jgi:3D (Asp-Asp-Asp) domain-containing protein